MQGEDGRTSEAEQQRQFREDRDAQSPVSARSGSVAVLDRPVTLEQPILFTPIAQSASAQAPVSSNDNFQAKSTYARLSIVVAGPIANFILAFLILLIGTLAFGTASSNVRPQIGILMPGSPAAQAGFKMGDTMLAIDAKPVTSGLALVDTIHRSAGKRLHITIERDGVTQTIAVTPQATKLGGGKSEGRIGFVPMPTYQRVPVGASFAVAGTDFVDMVKTQIGSYIALFTHLRENAGQLSGVIGMGAEAGTVQDLGWGPYFFLAANISIALGILNLLPFPALDGGRAVFIIAEMLRGRPVQPEKEALVHVTGFAVLMVLMVVIAYHDIFNLVTGKGV
jgi:regulator of sigma E protease